MGCTPITDLPEYDILPEIDGALVRVASTTKLAEFQRVVRAARKQWDFEERLQWAEIARKWYDWKITGERLESACSKLSGQRLSVIEQT
jgi:hypothetical protein